MNYKRSHFDFLPAIAKMRHAELPRAQFPIQSQKYLVRKHEMKLYNAMIWGSSDLG